MSSGTHEDFSRFSHFLVAPLEYSLSARFTRTDAEGHEASVFTVHGRIPFRQYLIVQPEVSHVSLFSNSDIFNSFGDFRVRFRLTAWSSNGAAVHLLGSVRTGSGTDRVFPYSTGSLDVEAGLAVVDTLASIMWWASATAVYPNRVDDTLKDAGLYGNHATVTGGVMIAMTDRLVLQGGVAAVMPDNADVRDVYFLDFDYQYTPATAFYALFQAEGAERSARATDFAIGAGVRVSF